MSPHKNSHKSSVTLGFLFGMIAFALFFGLLYQEDIRHQFQQTLSPEDEVADNADSIPRKGSLVWKKRSRHHNPPPHGSVTTYLKNQINDLREEISRAELSEKILTEKHKLQLTKLQDQIDLKSEAIAEKIDLIKDLKTELTTNNEDKASRKVRLLKLSSQLNTAKERISETEKRQEDLQAVIQGLTQKVQDENLLAWEAQSKEKAKSQLLKQKDDELMELANQMNLLTAQNNEAIRLAREAKENKIASLHEEHKQELASYKEQANTLLEERLQAKEHEIASLREENLQELASYKEQANTLLQEKLQDKEHEIASLREENLQELASYKEQANTLLEERLQDKEHEITSLREENLQELASYKEQANTLLQEKLQDKEHEITSLREENLQELASYKEQANTLLQEKLQDKEHEIASLREEVDTVREEKLNERTKLVNIIQNINHEFDEVALLLEEPAALN